MTTQKTTRLQLGLIFEKSEVRLQADLGGRQELHHLPYHGFQVGEDDLQGEVFCELKMDQWMKFHVKLGYDLI